MEILIVGAGVGGLAAARGLAAAGHRVRVLEAGDGLRRGGAAVSIYSNGAAALAALGAPVERIGGRIDILRFDTWTGARLMHVDLRVLHRATGRPTTTVSREELVGHLATGLPGGLIRFGAEVADVAVHDDGMTVTDTGGRRYRADVVVGADGHRSAVRSSLVDPAPAQDSGWATWQGLSAVLPELAAGSAGHFLVGPAGFVGMMPAGGGRTQWWFDTPWSRAEPAPGSPVARLRARFAGYAPPVPALLDAITDADIGCYPHVTHRVPDAWGRGAGTLVGDAAHAFPPTQAQGANQALEDAWLLTRALGLPGRPAELLRRYERRRVPRVRLVSRMAASEATDKPPGAWLRLATSVVPPRLAARGYLALIRRFSSILHDEHP